MFAKGAPSFKMLEAVVSNSSSTWRMFWDIFSRLRSPSSKTVTSPLGCTNWIEGGKVWVAVFLKIIAAADMSKDVLSK